MRYKITIEELDEDIKEKETWERLYDTDAIPEGKKQYGYVIMKHTETEFHTIYSQEKETINLENVIKAVNEIL